MRRQDYLCFRAVVYFVDRSLISLPQLRVEKRNTIGQRSVKRFSIIAVMMSKNTNGEVFTKAKTVVIKQKKAQTNYII